MVIHLFPGWVNAGENGGSKLVKKTLFSGSMLVVIYRFKYICLIEISWDTDKKKMTLRNYCTAPLEIKPELREYPG